MTLGTEMINCTETDMMPSAETGTTMGIVDGLMAETSAEGKYVTGKQNLNVICL